MPERLKTCCWQWVQNRTRSSPAMLAQDTGQGDATRTRPRTEFGVRIAPPPSMMMVVKLHQAFSSAARTDHAAGRVPILARVRALRQSILSPSCEGRHRVAFALTLPVGGVRLGPGARPERPSIRGGPAVVP